jgi:hypothetical protein
MSRRVVGTRDGPSAALIVALIVGVACAVAIRLAARASVRRAVDSHVQSRPVAVPDDGYVTSGGCRACHPSEYQSWSRSFHRTMTQLAEPETVLPAFDGSSIAGVQDNPIVLARRGAEFWATFDDPDSGAKDAPRRLTRQVVLLTGSHQQQAFWYRTDQTRLLGQLPAVYLIRERTWIPRRSAFLRPPSDNISSETGRWNGVCVNCHATHGKRKVSATLGEADRGLLTADTTVAELGIGCEACHGPGGEHARANRNPLRRYRLHLSDGRDPSTIQPSRLDAQRSSQVCGQCHAVWEFYNRADERKENAEGLAYRPGRELRDSRFVVQPTRDLGASTMQRLLARYPAFLSDSFWSDGMIRVSGREYNGLIDSPCYAKAKDSTRRLSCFSCHAMHQPSDDARPAKAWADGHQLQPQAETNHACLGCHDSMRANVSSHTRHPTNSSGSLCYNCHMPYTTYGLLRAQRSHRISSPSVAATVDTGRPNACNGCHLDQTLAWSADKLAAWYAVPPVPLDAEQRTVAASLLLLLKGDAGQRALVAWSMGWTPAQEASGTAWEVPFLALALNDPYDAVRLIVARSLRTFEGFQSVDLQVTAPPTQRIAASRHVAELWGQSDHHDRAAGRLLFKDRETLDLDAIARIMARRDDRRVNLRE